MPKHQLKLYITRQERRLLCFYYIYKDYVNYEIVQNKVLIPKYFQSEDQIINVYNSLKRKEWIDGNYEHPTKISAAGILEVETNDDLVKHSVLETLSLKKMTEGELIKKITITRKHLKQISEELNNLNEVELDDHRFGRATYVIEILPKGKRAYYEGKYLEDKIDSNKPIEIQKWYKRGFFIYFIYPLIVAVLAGIIIWSLTRDKEQKSTTINNPTQVNSNNYTSINNNSNHLKQTNKGDVNNYLSKGKKITYNYFLIPRNYKVKIDTTQHHKNELNQPIINNGGIVNQGGTGNTYNQTINNGPQRYYGYDRIDQIVATLSSNIEIDVKPFMNDKESETYANDIIKNLNKEGYYNTKLGGYFTEPCSSYGRISVKADSNLIQIFIYPLSPYGLRSDHL